MGNTKTTETAVWDGERYDIPKKDCDKFQQVFLYIVKKLADRKEVGETTIHKLLYFVDFDHYELYERQLMGLEYTKSKCGITSPMFSERYTGDMAKLGLLTAEERRHIDSVIARLDERTKFDLSDSRLEALLHKDVPWIAAAPHEQLEYEAVFYRNSNTSVRKYDDEV